MGENSKKLNLNKYSFLFYLKADFYCWMSNNDNYLSFANHFPEVKDLTTWRWKELTKQHLSDSEIPGTIIDGLQTSKWSRLYFKTLFPELRIIDLEDPNNHLNQEQKLSYTTLLLNQEDNFILFEGSFKYNDFVIRTDVIIKKTNQIKLLELKASTCPEISHGLDLMFQYKLLQKLQYPVENWTFRLLTLNGFFQNFPEQHFDQQILRLFIEWDLYFRSKPKVADYNQWKEKGISIKELLHHEDYYWYFDNFDQTLEKIKNIQLLDMPPKEIFQKRNFLGIDSDYQNLFLEYNGVAKEHSVFEFSGDSQFSNWEKAKLFNNNYKEISDFKNSMLIKPKDLVLLSSSTKEVILNSENITQLFTTSNSFIKNDISNYSKKLKLIFQKTGLITNSPIILRDKIINHLKQYQKIIYMFDFETVQQAIPLIKESYVYEQVPYQYSIHVILDKNDYDFKTIKNIVHLEWLAENRDFYDDFWKNFLRDITLFGLGTYVSFNKSFENKIISNRIEKSHDIQEIVLLKQIQDNTVDLMEPFINKWYYHADLKGKYSIKLVGPHFAPEINYKNLDARVQKGDQSAKQCKIWLINDDDDDEHQRDWEKIRPSMLEYCKYDTWLMVAIFEKLSKLIQ